MEKEFFGEKIIKTPEQDKEFFNTNLNLNSQEKYNSSFGNLNEKKAEAVARDVLEKYPKEAISLASPEYLNKKNSAEAIVLKLSPDEDDKKMEEFLSLINKVGILNTINAIEKTESFHIKDDFHRFLVQYLKSGYQPKKLKEKEPFFISLKRTLFKIQIPNSAEEEDKNKNLKELLSSMEQFFSGMFAVSSAEEENYFSLEIALAQNSDEVDFYCAIPDGKENIFKNQLLAVFPKAKILEASDDYNIFNKKKLVAGSFAKLKKNDFFPLTTYKNLDYDPLNLIIQAFSNLKKEEGAAIQINLKTPKKPFSEKVRKAIKQVDEGKDVNEIVSKKTSFLVDLNNKIYNTFLASNKNEEKSGSSEEKNFFLEQLKEKNSSSVFEANINIVSAGETERGALQILSAIEAAFMQFENPAGNSLFFEKVDGKKLQKLIKNFTYRIFDKKNILNLNISELSSFFHFPKKTLEAGETLSSGASVSSGVDLKLKKISEEALEDFQGSSFSAPEKKVENEKVEAKNFPSENFSSQKDNNLKNISEDNFQEKENELSYSLGKVDDFEEKISKKSFEEEKKRNDNYEKFQEKKPEEKINFESEKIEKPEEEFFPQKKSTGKILLGINEHQGEETKIFMNEIDRMRHLYVIGQTGTGKTTLLKNAIIQDIENGEGVCFIDPHGSDIEDILKNIPPERAKDVVYFDPSDMKKVVGLNMLEYDKNFPEQKTFVVDEMLSIFNKLFDMKATGGPMFEQYFRNAVMLTIEDPESGSTLLDVSRVLSDSEFREMKLSKSKNLITNQFWQKIAQQAQGEASLENIVPYITSKFDNFLSNDIMRPIIAQQKSSLNFRKIMDEKKILLVNLSKGRLGELNAHLLGLIIVGKILMAALSRVDSDIKNLPPFYLYIDEFQNITTDSISQILSEARKYKLSLNIAHQYISQIDEDIKNAVFGNVGSLAVFRVGSEDAEFLEKQFLPTFSSKDIIGLKNHNAYIKLLVGGEPVKPFNIKTLAPEEGSELNLIRAKEISSEKYGREKALVDREIEEKFRQLI